MVSAAGADANSEILTLSNFGARVSTPVGQHRGMARFGSYDMAGNVKEWVANPLGDRRGVLGDPGTRHHTCSLVPMHDHRCLESPRSGSAWFGAWLPPPRALLMPRCSFRSRLNGANPLTTPPTGFRETPRVRQDRARGEDRTHDRPVVRALGNSDVSRGLRLRADDGSSGPAQRLETSVSDRRSLWHVGGSCRTRRSRTLLIFRTSSSCGRVERRSSPSTAARWSADRPR